MSPVTPPAGYPAFEDLVRSCALAVSMSLLICLSAFADPVDIRRVDHGDWSALLERYVDEDGLVAYAAWKASAEDQAALDAYLEAMGQVDPAALADQPERIAFWLNVYNAQTVRFILSVWPTDSIRKHTGWVRFNVWKDYAVRVNGKDYSLHAIEHELLRPMGEPLIHLGLVCASRGCPKLRRSAYSGLTVLERLEDNARDFLSREANFRVDRKRGRVFLSSIFQWFRDDFGGTDRKLLDWVAARVEDPEARAFLSKAELSVRYLDYDWAINARD